MKKPCRRRQQRGTALLEFTLTVPLLLSMAWGVYDLSSVKQQQIAINDAARVGARYAANNPRAWDSTSSPASNTIEYQVLSENGTGGITNDYQHLKIQYYAPGSGTQTLCGHYDPATGYQNDNGYVQGVSCVVPGTYIEVVVTRVYQPVTPMVALFPHGITVSAASWMVELQ